MEAAFYSPNPKFYVAVDCIVFCYEKGELKVLLQKRYFEPFKGEYTLMGGFVQEDESVREAALRVIEERTGIKGVYIEQVGAFGDVDRDPAARVVSVAYMALVNKALCDESLNKEHNGFWINVYDVPHLMLGHDEMLAMAIDQLRIQIGRRPIGFNLIPEKFTLTQLQNLHEAILGQELDKRNFRKRVAEFTFIEKTSEMDKIHSKRGAALYRYNKKEYEKTKKFKL